MSTRKDLRTMEYGVRVSVEEVVVVKLIDYNGDGEEIQGWIHDIVTISEKEIKERLISQGLSVETVVKSTMKHKKR